MKIAVYTPNYRHLIGTLEQLPDDVLGIRPGTSERMPELRDLAGERHAGESTGEFLARMPQMTPWFATLEDGEEPSPGFYDAGRENGDKIPGGLADRIPPSAFDPTSTAEGAKVETEHTADPNVASEIARDHLAEDPEYYAKIKAARLSLTPNHVLGRKVVN